ncbi:hypothetical protein PHMEG_0008247 [Phytophthora megakarya]|uniref:EF-hand domain-containing protein n=1 Tax=Phytophthora megakarya TaxID=4795 RepID=A0A225WJ65_9STRA|nr:hypothetical protein PHMEG_0008247 [Phytophthora megakarya]
MPKGTAFYNAVSNLENTATKTVEVNESGRFTSSAKYRVSSNLPEPISVDASETRPFTANALTLSVLKRMSKDSAGRPTSGTVRKANFRYSINTEAISSSKVFEATGRTPKLPQKLRQHVNRLRNQFASRPSSSNNLIVGGRNSSPHKARPRMSSASAGARKFSFATAAAIQYSHQSNQKKLQVTKEDVKSEVPVIEMSTTSQIPEPTSVNSGTFHDLLRPLQTSLSCASLSGEWSSDDEDEAEQLFRQSERENSRMLRVCCSIDNLMQSIGDQAQEQKHTEAIARGATRDLVKLFQFALKQAVAVIFDKTDDQASNNNNLKVEEGTVVRMTIDGKEAQYAIEFLLEINERIGKLYEFARSVFVNEVDGLRQRIQELDIGLAAATLANNQLNNEMRDLRDFHEQNDVNTGGNFASNGPGARYPELDHRCNDTLLSTPAFPKNLDDTVVASDEEYHKVNRQCQELSRLLEMAKQEIRLSHHERDVQKTRVAEISSALFHDSELGLLRNQLQSEKKRVRVLERENLALRESQQDQSLKLQPLEALETDTSVSGWTTSCTDTSVTERHSISVIRPSSDTIPTIAHVVQHEILENQSTEERPSVHINALMVDTQDDQYNFISAGATQPEEGIVVNWFSRMVNPLPPSSLRKLRKKQTESKTNQPPVSLSKFLAGLLMTEKQLTTATEESKVRRQGRVPTLIPPMRALSARNDKNLMDELKMADKKRRPQSATVANVSSSNMSRTNNAEVEDNPEEVIASCLQLVWVFYQRFLVAIEAQHLIATRGLCGDPTLGSGTACCAGNPAMEPVSLSLVIFHFFLERCNRELEAAQELEQFVRCLHSVRRTRYSLDLFCQFLEETSSRQELCFYLWVCQAMDDVRLGIPYDDPLPSRHNTSNYRQEFVCVLKATFLSRTIFRLLHFKVLCRPQAVGNRRRRRKPKRKPVTRSFTNSAAFVVAPISPSSGSPKRRQKTRLGELTATILPKTDSIMATADNGEAIDEKESPPYVAAQMTLRHIIGKNAGEPITLETFNNLLLQYAIVPSSEELTARMGPFYQPTGDERKIPVDVFFALLMEIYKFQLQWQRDQLRGLFSHLNQQQEVLQHAAEKLAKAEAADVKGGKHITFDSLYDALQKMKWLNSTRLRVDSFTEGTKMMDTLPAKRNSVDAKAHNARPSLSTTSSPTVLAIRDKWRVYARHSLALCNNDPNVFVRRHSQRLLYYVDQELIGLVNVSEGRDAVNEGGDAMQCIREFLAFAWRIAAKRSNGSCSTNLNQTCLTEVFLISQALRATADPMPGYHGRFIPTEEENASSSPGTISALRPNRGSIILQDGLQSFYDTSQMNLIKANFTCVPSQLHELENVLALYSTHIAHLFQRFSEARYNYIPQVSFHRWKAMVYELNLVDPRLPFSNLQTLFSNVATDAVNYGSFTNIASMDQELGVGKSRFSELFVLIAIERHHFAKSRKIGKARLFVATKVSDDNKESILESAKFVDRPGRIMAQFCRDILIPRALRGDNTLVERDFAAKLSCPLVGRALLEHRSFLRTVFFYYAKQDEVAADKRDALKEQELIRERQENGGQLNGIQQPTADSANSDVNGAVFQPGPGFDFQLEKTKRSSMSFGEFQTFLAAFGLLDDPIEDSHHRRNAKIIALADAQQVFSSVMSLENDDTLQLEFDEFAAAMVALAVHLNPNPFSLWHQKLDEFAVRLRQTWETMSKETSSLH